MKYAIVLPQKNKLFGGTTEHCNASIPKCSDSIRHNLSSYTFKSLQKLWGLLSLKGRGGWTKNHYSNILRISCEYFEDFLNILRMSSRYPGDI